MPFDKGTRFLLKDFPDERQISASLCISEIRALQQGKRRVDPETLFVKK